VRKDVRKRVVERGREERVNRRGRRLFVFV
jgi:hypothetical protein